MDNRHVMLVEVRDYLIELTRIVEYDNKAGYYDVNKDSENRAVNLFNLIYGYDLKNANSILSDNFPAIDLIDDNLNIVIQVTATSELGKVIYTLEKFIEKKLYESYNRVIIYILTDKPKYYATKTIKKFNEITKKYIKFDHKKDIIDNKDLLKTITGLVNINNIKEIHQYLSDELTNNKNQKPIILKELNAFAKYRTDNLIGRDSVISEIHSKFINNELVLLQGTGGIGKTVIAKSYLEKYRDLYDHLAYIDVTDSLQSTIFKKLGSTDSSFQYDYNESVNVNLSTLINKLYLIKNTLLVIDNCNNEDELRLFKNDLKSLNWKILITSRTQPSSYIEETIKVSHLLPEYCYDLFIKNYRKLNDDEKIIVNRILLKIKYHTKLTIILAKAAFINPLLKLEELADRVNKELYDEEKINVLVSLDTEEHSVYEFLLLLFKPEDLSKDHQRYLKYFSILPNQELSIEHLIHLYERNEKHGFFINLINKLTEKGWIEAYENYYRIHPLIQLVTKKKLPINIVNCGEIIDNLIHYLRLSNNYMDNSIYLSYGESVLNYFGDEQAHKIGMLANYVSVIYRDLHKLPEALKYNILAIEILELESKKSAILAQAYGNLCTVYTSLYQYTNAINASKTALDIQLQVLRKDHYDIGATYSNTANIYIESARHSKVIYEKLRDYNYALGYLNEAVRIQEKDFRSSKDAAHSLSFAYNGMAMVYEDMYYINHDTKYLDLKFEYDNKSLEIARKYLGEHHPATAIIYSNNGLGFLKNGNIEIAEEYIQKALDIREAILPENHPEIGISYYNLARVQIGLRQREKAKSSLIHSIKILEESYQPNHLTLIDAKELYSRIR